MQSWSTDSLSFQTIRPLVRYVDDKLAIIDTHVQLTTDADDVAHDSLRGNVQLHLQLIGPLGETHTHTAKVMMTHGGAFARFEVQQPERWWPAGMGEQVLYDYCVSLMDGDEVIDSWRMTLGLTSVRKQQGQRLPALLVNGRSCPIRSVLPVDQQAESEVLPIAGNTLLIVREHFAPDVLFEAADRAGILLVQSIPLGKIVNKDSVIEHQVDRLSGHPSLAGWLIDRADKLADRIARRVRHLDPTRNVFRKIPA